MDQGSVEPSCPRGSLDSPLQGLDNRGLIEGHPVSLDSRLGSREGVQRNGGKMLEEREMDRPERWSARQTSIE